jgi:SAM-dependent methyltransferase
MTMIAQPLDNWDQHWSRFAEAARRNPAQQMRHAIITELLRRDDLGQPMRILDIGSGQGDLLQKIHGQMPRAQLLGFELSRSGAEISRAKVPQATVIVGDLFQPPEALQAYARWATDAICSEVLEHVDDPTAFLKAARCYLADNARLIVTVPGGPMSAFDRHIGHRRHFDRRTIGTALQKAGFAVDHVSLAGFPFFNLYRTVVIARGRKLVVDADAAHRGTSAWLANVVMAAFRGLFRFNLPHCPFGWQVVAVAHRGPPDADRGPAGGKEAN